MSEVCIYPEPIKKFEIDPNDIWISADENRKRLFEELTKLKEYGASIPKRLDSDRRLADTLEVIDYLKSNLETSLDNFNELSIKQKREAVISLYTDYKKTYQSVWDLISQINDTTIQDSEQIKENKRLQEQVQEQKNDMNFETAIGLLKVEFEGLIHVPKITNSTSLDNKPLKFTFEEIFDFVNTKYDLQKIQYNLKIYRYDYPKDIILAVILYLYKEEYSFNSTYTIHNLRKAFFGDRFSHGNVTNKFRDLVESNNIPKVKNTNKDNIKEYLKK